MQPATKRYYMYILSDQGTPFYVGKGQAYRISHHETEARTDCFCLKCIRIRSIWLDKREVQRLIVFESDNEAEVLQHERDTIAQLGRSNLCNRSNGGEPGGRPEYITEKTMRARLRAEFKRNILPRKSRFEQVFYWREDMQLWVEDRIREMLRDSRQ